jgi:hypothetical protein
MGALSILVALMSWALASPVGSSPDEDFHLVSTWCGHGLRSGVCEKGNEENSRRVTSSLLKAPCYAFHAEVSASCQTDGFAGPKAELVPTNRGNFTGTYPPVFYFFTNLFVGSDISFSVVAMRFANAALFVLLIAATYIASAPGLRRSLLLGSAVTLVPLGMFIVPSINPSSWAVLSAATLAVSVLGYLTTAERPRRLILGGLAAISLLVGAGARADAAMYAVIAIVASLILVVRRGRGHARRVIYPIVLAIIATLAYFSVGQSSAVAGGSLGAFELGRFARILLDIPSLWIGGLGAWGLGWLDTTMPPLVWVLAFGIFGATVFAAFAQKSLRRGLATGVVGLALWIIPAYVQYLANAPVGAEVQPRYILPLLTVLAVIALARIDGMAFSLGTGQRWIVVAGLSLANAIALHTNIRRYVTGTDVPSLNLNFHEEWWWGIPVSPLAVWALGAVAFAVGLVLLTKELTIASPAEREDVVEGEGEGEGEPGDPGHPAILEPADDAVTESARST